MLTEDEVRNALAKAIVLYDKSGDFWFGFRDDVDINVYIENDRVFVTAYGYDAETHELNTNKFQPLLVETVEVEVLDDSFSSYE